MTPHLLAEASRRTTTPASCSPSRASGVMKEFAPSTITCAEGVPSARRKRRQFEPSIVSGRPPAGMKRSACDGEDAVVELLVELVERDPTPRGPPLGHLDPAVQLAQALASAAVPVEDEAARREARGVERVGVRAEQDPRERLAVEPAEDRRAPPSRPR